jgi:hypothetical protein
LTESVGPVPFSAEHLICRYVRTDRQTDRQTDELIRVGLGNLFGSSRYMYLNRSVTKKCHKSSDTSDPSERSL